MSSESKNWYYLRKEKVGRGGSNTTPNLEKARRLSRVCDPLYRFTITHLVQDVCYVYVDFHAGRQFAVNVFDTA